MRFMRWPAGLSFCGEGWADHKAGRERERGGERGEREREEGEREGGERERGGAFYVMNN